MKDTRQTHSWVDLFLVSSLALNSCCSRFSRLRRNTLPLACLASAYMGIEQTREALYSYSKHLSKLTLLREILISDRRRQKTKAWLSCSLVSAAFLFVACNTRACSAFVYLDYSITDASGLPAEDLVLQRLVHYNIGHFLQIHWTWVW